MLTMPIQQVLLVALDNFNSIKHSSKVAILGDMFELGELCF